MATSFNYFLTVRDHTLASGVDNRKTGLTGTVIMLRNAVNNTVLATTLVGVYEVGLGIYKLNYDPETNGEAVGQIDFGTGLTLPDDRYVDFTLTAYGLLTLNQTVANTLANPGNTVGAGLLGGEAASFGGQSIAGTAFKIMARDGITVLKTFTLNSTSNPTQRT